MRTLRLCSIALVLAFMPWQSIAAQCACRLNGRVTTADGSPIAKALVDVENTFLQTTTRATGAFILKVHARNVTLRVRRIGFAPLSVSVIVPADSSDVVVIKLLPIAAALSGIAVTENRSTSLATTISRETVRQAPPLGEADILRLLPLLPSVAQANDVLARLHLGGGASDEHGVTLDEHPLQAPFHLNSVLGAFNVAALEGAELRVHHLPASADGRLSGMIALETKTQTEPAETEAVVSVLSGSLTTSQPSLPMGVSALASGRITYMDRVVRRLLRSSTSVGDDYLLPSYRDVLLKLGRSFGDVHVSALAYDTRDEAAESGSPLAHSMTNWGERLLGLTASYRRDEWSITARTSLNEAEAHSERPYTATGDSSATLRLGFIDIAQRWSSSSIEVGHLTAGGASAFGITSSNRIHSHQWDSPRVGSLLNTFLPSSASISSAQRILGVFAEQSVLSSSGWRANGGAHVSISSGGAWVAPRFVLTHDLARATRIELALNRRHQFDAIAGEPVEGSITQPVFLLDRPRVMDMAALSLNWRPVGARGGVEVVGFGRRYRNRTSLAPGSDTASSLQTTPSFRRVPGTASGASISGDYATSSFVLQGGYSFQRSRETVDGLSRPTSWDAPHQFSVFGAIHPRSWTLSAVYQIHSGAAVTPVSERVFVPLDEGRFAPRFIYGAPNSARMPFFSRLDLAARRTWTLRGAAWTLSFQAVNVLNRTNVLEYRWQSFFACEASAALCGSSEGRREGLPFLPSVGLEIRW